MPTDTQIPNTEISRIIVQLYASIGVRPMFDINDVPCIANRDNFSATASKILAHMRLPIRLIPDFTTPYESTGLTRANTQQGVAAQVLIPQSLPSISSDSLKGFPITVRLRLDGSSGYTLWTMLTHELSHILLHAWGIPLKESEHATDLCALMLGFGDLWDLGRKRTTRELVNASQQLVRTITYGYLSDDNYDFARQYITDLINPFAGLRFQIRSQIADIQTLCEQCAEQTDALFKMLDYHRSCNCRVRQPDAELFSALSRPSSRADLESEVESHKAKANTLVRKLKAGRAVWNDPYLAELRDIYGRMESILASLHSTHQRLEGQTLTVERNLSLFSKLALWIKRKLG